MTDRAVAKFQALVRIPTVSDRAPDRVDTDAFDRLHAELRRQFPSVHERLELTRVGDHGQLFHWPGASAARPVVLMAHLDVVPVVESAPWQHQRLIERLPASYGQTDPHAALHLEPPA